MTGHIALVGGSGFVGSSTNRRLSAAGVPAVVVDTVSVRVAGSAGITDAPPSFSHADVRDLPGLSAVLAGATAIINLAAVHRDDVRPVSLYGDVNVGGARNVCEAARRNGINRIIFTSSVAIYGFAPLNTDETGDHNHFNDYGRTKAEAEAVYREWQAEDPDRSLVIVRPTVIFGEGNRGNVFNLLKQMASGRFVMVGHGENVKSMAYVENVAAFLVYALSFGSGVHVYNYVDKPDMSMNDLVGIADRMLGRSGARRIHVPYWIGYLGGLVFDALAAVTGKSFPVSAIRVKKFCSNTQFAADRVRESGFVPPVALPEGLERTIRYEFIEDHAGEKTFQTE